MNRFVNKINGEYSRIIKSFKKKLTNENERIRTQFLCLYVIFGVVSFGMTLVNLLTKWDHLMILTLIFGIMNVVNFLCSIKHSVLEYIIRVLFAMEIVWLFACFIIKGEPEGFSAIWIVLLPAGGLLLYRKKAGTLLSLGMFLLLVFFFWTPVGRSLLQYEYTDSFMFRFPLLYLAFFMVGLFFELIRSLTQEELNDSRNRYIKLSYTDLLTGLGNESKYLILIERLERNIKDGKAQFGVVFMDVNNVKAVNDRYGHQFGCNLIVTAGKLLPTIFPHSRLFHIGGDEFVAVLFGEDYENAEAVLSKFDEELQYRTIQYEGIDMILSVARGYSAYKPGDKYNSVMQRADESMYQNKQAVKEKYHISLR